MNQLNLCCQNGLINATNPSESLTMDVQRKSLSTEDEKLIHL